MEIISYVIFWPSKIIFNLVSLENKLTFRKLENFEKKKIRTHLHREFNQIYMDTYIICI